MQRSKHTPHVVYINVPENILIPMVEQDRIFKTMVLTAVQDAGLAWLTPIDIIAAASVAMTEKNLTIPYADVDMSLASKAQKIDISTQREAFVTQILQQIDARIKGSKITYFLEENDITARIKNATASRTVHHQMWMRGVNAFVIALLEKATAQEPIAYIATDPPRLTEDTMNPVVGIVFPSQVGSQAGRRLRLRKKADVVLTMTDTKKFGIQLAAVMQDFTALRQQRSELQNDLQNGRIKLEPQFERSTWPDHPLVAQLKKGVREAVQNVLQENGAICDPLDLEYQTLFRLTSLPVAAVFEDGIKLEAYLQSQDAYGYWRNILTLDPKRVSHPLKTRVVEEIAREQLRIILDRIQQTTLPIANLTQRKGIFAEQGWKLQKHGGSVAAIKVEDGNIIDKRNIVFKPVDTTYAKELHAVLHYIHTPRAKKAFGMYLEDETLPFSVVAFDDIDRPYKKDLLLMLGHNPDRCLDLARLYSKPGTPFNTSSTIFTLAFAHFREHEPEVQAVLSAFMPTYAHGMSMISAGFNYGSLIKEWRHSFAEREIDGEKAWELVTKRRKEGETQKIIDSQWPLLPVFELYVPIRPPRFTPFKELGGMMVSRNL